MPLRHLSNRCPAHGARDAAAYPQRAVGIAVVALLGAIAGAPSLAQDLSDPTAPPAILRALSEGNANPAPRAAEGIAGTAEPAEAQADAPAPPPRPVLRVREAIRGDWRTRAVVGGELVRWDPQRPPDREAAQKPVVAHDVNKQRPGSRTTRP